VCHLFQNYYASYGSKNQKSTQFICLLYKNQLGFYFVAQKSTQFLLHKNQPEFYCTKINQIFIGQKLTQFSVHKNYSTICLQIILTIEGEITSLVSEMSTAGTDALVSQSFRLAVQQLITNYRRHMNSSSVHISAISADALLNRLESTLNIVEEGIDLLSTSSLYSEENVLLLTFCMSLATCVRTLQYSENDSTVPPVFIPSSTLHYSGLRGRPTILLNLETVELLSGSGYTWNEIVWSLQVSRTTPWRHLNDSDYEIEKFTDISDDELDSILRQLQRDDLNCGQLLLQGYLSKQV